MTEEKFNQKMKDIAADAQADGHNLEDAADPIAWSLTYDPEITAYLVERGIEKKYHHGYLAEAIFSANA